VPHLCYQYLQERPLCYLQPCNLDVAGAVLQHQQHILRNKAQTISMLLQSQPAAVGGTASAATNAAVQQAGLAGAAVASDAHKSSSNAASTATAKPTTRATGRQPPAKSKSQEIPKGRTTANQRMTRAAAARAAAELADTAPGSVMEEEDEDAMDEDMAEGPRPDYDMVITVACSVMYCFVSACMHHVGATSCTLSRLLLSYQHCSCFKASLLECHQQLLC